MESALGLNDSMVIFETTKSPSLKNDRKTSDTTSSRSGSSSHKTDEAGQSLSDEDSLTKLPCQIMSLEKEEEDEPETETCNHKKNKILRKTVFTILLTHHWRKKNLEKSTKDGRKPPIQYEPTYRQEPVVNVKSKQILIRTKLQETFDNLNFKHENYDTEYSPRFLRIISEMMKNECKAFNLDRYKIIVQVSLLEKKYGQSIEIISKLLASNKTDLRICFNYEGKTFYTICLVFFIYNE